MRADLEMYAGVEQNSVPKHCKRAPKEKMYGLHLHAPTEDANSRKFTSSRPQSRRTSPLSIPLIKKIIIKIFKLLNPNLQSFKKIINKNIQIKLINIKSPFDKNVD